VAWLKEWDSVGGAQTGMRRVDLTPDCEQWLANRFPKTTALHDGAGLMAKAAQDVRYYLKHQGLPAWADCSEYEKGVLVTCQNIEKLLLDRLSDLAAVGAVGAAP
jgi:hypothetical protein